MHLSRITARLRSAKSLLDNRWLRLTVQVMVLTVSVSYLAINFRNARELLAGLSPHYDLLIGAFLLTVVAVFLGAVGWGFSLKAFYEGVPWKLLVSIHLGSNLAKYLPGYAWQLAGKAYLTNRQGVKPNIVASAMILEMSQLMLLGFGLALLALPREMIKAWIPETYHISVAMICKSLGTIVIILTPVVLISIIQRATSWIGTNELKRSSIYASSAAIWIGWTVFSTAFYLMGRAIIDLSSGLFSGFVFTLTTSFIIGLLIVIVPGSIGVRESLMVYFLSLVQIPSSAAVLIAIISRLIVTLSEIFCYLVFRNLIGRGDSYQDRKPISLK